MAVELLGEPGMGKTRLLVEARAQAAEGGTRPMLSSGAQTIVVIRQTNLYPEDLLDAVSIHHGDRVGQREPVESDSVSRKKRRT